MNYISIKDLKTPRRVRESLSAEHQLVLTRDGTPFALMVEVGPECVEESLREVRRAMFSAAVTNIRRRARGTPVAAADIDGEVAAARLKKRVQIDE